MLTGRLSRLLFGAAACLAVPVGFAGTAGAQQSEGGPRKFPEHTPEHQALTASSPYLGDDEFYLRNDYWKGNVTTRTGTAMRLQFFKGNAYTLFFGADTKALPKSAVLHLHLFDAKSREVDTAKGEPGEAAVVLNHKTRKTGLYLVLMRIVIPDSGEQAGTAEVSVPSVLFYGWK